MRTKAHTRTSRQMSQNDTHLMANTLLYTEYYGLDYARLFKIVIVRYHALIPKYPYECTTIGRSRFHVGKRHNRKLQAPPSPPPPPPPPLPSPRHPGDPCTSTNLSTKLYALARFMRSVITERPSAGVADELERRERRRPSLQYYLEENDPLVCNISKHRTCPTTIPVHPDTHPAAKSTATSLKLPISASWRSPSPAAPAARARVVSLRIRRLVTAPSTSTSIFL